MTTQGRDRSRASRQCRDIDTIRAVERFDVNSAALPFAFLLASLWFVVAVFGLVTGSLKRGGSLVRYVLGLLFVPVAVAVWQTMGGL